MKSTRTIDTPIKKEAENEMNLIIKIMYIGNFRRSDTHCLQGDSYPRHHDVDDIYWK